MRLGVMQPYFFPYLEHFRLMAACDLWVVFDTVEYRRRTWMNRNRILNREQGWSYLHAPVERARRGTCVSDVRLAEHVPWRADVADRVRVYEHHAPHYTATRSLVQSALDAGHELLVDLNAHALRAVANALGIDTAIVRLSELGLDLPAQCGPGEWALNIATALEATEYRNPAGGVDLFDRRQFEAAGIQLTFHEPADDPYPTPGFDYVPGLSVIDTLMWVDREALGDRVHGVSPGPDHAISLTTSSRYSR